MEKIYCNKRGRHSKVDSSKRKKDFWWEIIIKKITLSRSLFKRQKQTDL